jgi:hypothetical protein
MIEWLQKVAFFDNLNDEQLQHKSHSGAPFTMERSFFRKTSPELVSRDSLGIKITSILHVPF